MIFCRLAVDEETRPNRLLVGLLRALTVAFFSDHEQKSHVDFFLAKPLRSCNLHGDDSLGIARSSAINLECVFRGRNERWHRVHVGREDRRGMRMLWMCCRN